MRKKKRSLLGFLIFYIIGIIINIFCVFPYVEDIIWIYLVGFGFIISFVFLLTKFLINQFCIFFFKLYLKSGIFSR